MKRNTNSVSVLIAIDKCNREHITREADSFEPQPSPESKKRGRPRGKKSDPEFICAIAYIRKKTHLQVKRLLLDKQEQGDKQDFSELVQNLLDFWVKFQQGENPETLLARFLDNQKSNNSHNSM